MIITRWNRLFDTSGTEQELAWAELVELLTTRTEYLGGDEHPGWSPVRLTPCERGSENVREVHALAFDFDKGETIADSLGRLRKLGRGTLHTTRKHQRDGHGDRFRVVYQLSRPVSWFEFGELWRRVAPAAGSIDESPKDGSRFWYLPGTVEGGEFVSRTWEGEPLDVDAWLRKPDPVRPRPLPVALPKGEQSNVEDRARKYIAKMDPAIAKQGGHGSTWHVAIVLCRGFALSEERAYALLCEYNTRCEPPWSERELKHKISGAQQARVPLGFLLESPREWKTYTSQIPEPTPDDQPAPVLAEASTEREPGDDSDEVPRVSAVERWKIADLRSICWEVVNNVKRGASARGHTTGNHEIDSLLCGLRPGFVSLVAAPTSWGKSTFGIMVADENLRLKVPVLVVSVEDTKLTYGKRIVARRSGVNAMRIRENDCDARELEKMTTVAMEAPSEPFFMDAVGMPVEEVAKAVMEICAEREVGVILFDYLQRFSTNRNFGDNRRAQVTYVAETLVNAGKRGGAHTMALSQLKRIEGREPTMDDIKESGDLENISDHVLLGHRWPSGERYNEGEERPMKRGIKVHKNKDGPTYTDKFIDMPFDLVTANFKTMDAGFVNRQAANDAERHLSSF